MTTCVCATHGHCFDGLASAAVFSELFESTKPRATFSYIACGYGPKQTAPAWGNEENALLDFRYHAADSLTFYFDHHTTAFVTKEDRAHFESRRATEPKRFIWDPAAQSCTGLIARLAQERWEVDLSKHAELIAFAEKMDGAQFESAEEASDRTDPRMRLCAVVERYGDSEFLSRAVPIARREGLLALASADFVKDRYRQLGPKFREYERRVRARGEMRGRVVFVDLTEAPVNAVAKFFHYREFPSATYSILVSRMSQGIKIGIGYNPWSNRPLDHNLGAICSEHGGGGHPFVGAISLTLDQMTEARELAARLVERLQQPNPEGTLV